MPRHSYASSSSSLPVKEFNDYAIRVLVVEDNNADVRLIKTILHGLARNEQYNITDVPRMADAIRLIDQGDFDLVISDLNLLDMSGIDTLARLSRVVAGDIPIMVYAGSMDDALQEKVIIYGASCCLTKEHTNVFGLKYAVQQILAMPRGT